MSLKKHKFLIIILSLGFILRLIGINFGLPHLYHADEPIVVNHAVVYSSLDFNPHFFKIPPFLSYILFFLYGIYFALGSLVGKFHSNLDFEKLFLTDPTSFYLIGRICFGVILGTVTVYFTYLLARKVFNNQKIALMGALFLVGSFLHLRNSHYIYCDIPMTCFLVLTVIYMIKIYQEPTQRNYLIVGLLAGITTGIKYNAAIICLPIFFTHALTKKVSLKEIFGDYKIYLCALVMMVSYLITNPFSLISFSEFFKELSSQAGAEGSSPVFYHLKYSLAGGIGVLMLLSALGGLLWMLIKKDKVFIVFLSFPIIFYIFIVFVSQTHERYVIPLIPFFCILSAFFIYKLCQIRFLKTKEGLFLLLLSLIIITPTLAKSIYLDYLFVSGDTRTQAREWIQNNIPQGSKIALDHSFFNPRLNFSSEQLREKLIEAKSEIQKKRINLLLKLTKEKPSYNLFFIMPKEAFKGVFLFAKPVIENSWEELRKQGIQYVIVHRMKPEKTKFYQELKNNATLVKTFSPYKNRTKVYSLDSNVNTAASFEAREILSRKYLGYTIQLYKII